MRVARHEKIVDFPILNLREITCGIEHVGAKDNLD